MESGEGDFEASPRQGYLVTPSSPLGALLLLFLYGVVGLVVAALLASAFQHGPAISRVIFGAVGILVLVFLFIEAVWAAYTLGRLPQQGTGDLPPGRARL